MFSLLLVLLGLSDASHHKLTVFQFPPLVAGGTKGTVEFNLSTTSVTSFSICLYFRPAYQIHRHVQTMLEIPGFVKLAIYEDSVGGSLQIGTENIIFDFPSALYPRTWNTFCIQQTSVARKIWHGNQTIYVEALNDNINFVTLVLKHNFSYFLSYTFSEPSLHWIKWLFW